MMKHNHVAIFALALVMAHGAAAIVRAQPGGPGSPASSANAAAPKPVQGTNERTVEAIFGLPGGPHQESFKLTGRLYDSLVDLGFTVNGSSRIAGLTLAQPDGALRSHLSLPDGHGLVVTSVEPSSTAHQAGLRANDILLALGDSPLAKPEDLETCLKTAGEKPVTLHLLRGGTPTSLEIQPEIRFHLQPVPPKPAANPYWIGIAVGPLDPSLRSQLQIAEDQGLIVNEVIHDGPAAKAGLRLNDILITVDGNPLNSSSNLSTIVQAHADKPIALGVIRAGKRGQSVTVTPIRREGNQAVSANVPERSWSVVQPGYVFNGALIKEGQWIADITPQLANGLQYVHSSVLSNPESPKPTSNVSADVSKRLDALDAVLKDLQKAVEELNKGSREKK